ncbi:mono/diheme cytochrome c family protein [Sphingomonas vulcanisoli]|uniref:Mono/diheme cytochrome c family protein n=1 Tax=Sphingomonas vulcanisoli TaxID=1658060 RepID=A0ABX0TQS0_9SPHN|nr:cytochrome c [Sphingomonas vulcanisoli]NIJ06499.1 mono/diheme cytochrome c family protein [Sphingomonas vulcanisoli]
MRKLSFLIAGAAVAALSGTAFAQFASGYSWKTGPEIYTHVCQGCHMPDGKGATGAGMYPALAGNRKLASPLYPVLVMLKGQKAMPSFSDLTDDQIAAVANYVRGNFGNSFPGTVTAEQVKALRAQAVQQQMRAPG